MCNFGSMLIRGKWDTKTDSYIYFYKKDKKIALFESSYIFAYLVNLKRQEPYFMVFIWVHQNCQKTNEFKSNP